MKEKRESKKGQLSVFIILAILIAIVLILLFINKDNLNVLLGKESPANQIEKCIKDSANEGLNILRAQGGSINPQNYYLYQGNKVDYVCYTVENYKRCVMQKPLLKENIEKELKEFLVPRINGCIESIKASLEKKDYSVSYKKPEISAEISPNNILIKTELDLKVEKEKSENYKDIKVNIDSKLYDLIMIESSIANWEARYGDSETMMYMYYYPDLKVEKKIRSDGTRIYILTERNTKEKLIFATRSVVFPPGLSGE